MKQYSLYADLFSYPNDRIFLTVADLLGLTSQSNEQVFEDLEKFSNSIANLTIPELKELYTRSFDLMAVCSPYIGIHLFGEDNYKRGGLMAKLNDEFQRRNFQTNKELPDHLAVILRFLVISNEEEAKEIVEYFLRQPLEKMISILNETKNPYLYLLKALQCDLGCSPAPSFIAVQSKETQ